MTFAEIRAYILRDSGAEALRPTFERSVRRALKGLVDDHLVVALGEGGRGDPARYCLNPMLLAFAGTKEQFEAAAAKVAAEPGGEAALNKLARAMFGGDDR